MAELHPEHISAYSLIIEEGTRFYQWYGKGQTDQEKYPPLPDEDAERQMYERTEEFWKNMDFIAMRFPIMHGKEKSADTIWGIGAE